MWKRDCIGVGRGDGIELPVLTVVDRTTNLSIVPEAGRAPCGLLSVLKWLFAIGAVYMLKFIVGTAEPVKLKLLPVSKAPVQSVSVVAGDRRGDCGCSGGAAAESRCQNAGDRTDASAKASTHAERSRESP